MSVINQMLKELEQRNEENKNSSGIGSAQLVQKRSNTVKIVLLILIVILLNILGLYVWNLYSENEAFKNAALSELKQQNKKPIELDSQVEEKPTATSKSVNSVTEPAEKLVSEQSSIAEEESKKDEPASNQIATKNKDNTQNKQVIQDDNVVITPVTQSEKSKPYTQPAETIKEQEPKQPTLTISRSQLSPERVVQNKLTKAERAIIDKDVPKAEQLFEDILLIQPDHKSARKQLAALWFGRKLFSPALNLLSQGISMYPDEVDFRLMKARILLNQNNNQAAYHVLNDFSTAKNVEYQALLANTAQSLGELDTVLLAYQQLVILEKHKGKWWMGLAVAMDQKSQFEEAKRAYTMALSKGDLSNNSAQFIRQRMNELGE